MSEKKHTPGPWFINSANDAVYCLGSSGGIVCLSPSVEGYNESAKNWPANAHLIAAAPEMLEALVELLDASNIAELPTREESDRLVRAEDAARAAIKKARGES